MFVSNKQIGDILITFYLLNKDEKINRHQHVFSHTTEVLHGMTEVEIFDGRSVFLMKPNTPTFSLPENIDHEIRALDDLTVILNITGNVKNAEIAKPGGVLLDDGTIVYGP